RVIVYRILPALTSEFVNPDMVPFVLPNVLLIAEECTKEEYIRLFSNSRSQYRYTDIYY
ncbi:hypothetical protein M9458_009344, partial [Cirrhinus mrigala]